MALSFGVVQDTLPTLPQADLAPLIAALDAFRRHAALATAMVAKLDALITRCEAIPVSEYDRWLTASLLYAALRRGTVPTPIAPHVWPWRTDLRTVEVNAFPLIIRVRDHYSRLDTHARTVATRQLGTIHNGGIDYTPVWLLGGWPRDALKALDDRAALARLDIVPLMTVTGALWAAHGIVGDSSVHKKRHGVRRKQPLEVR